MAALMDVPAITSAGVSLSDLLKALATVVKSTAVRTTLPILQTVRIEATHLPDSVTLTGTTSETWAKVTISAQVARPFSICVNARNLQSALSVMPDGVVNLELAEDRMLRVSIGPIEFTLYTLESTDFPELPGVEPEHDLRFDLFDFRGHLAKVDFAMSQDAHRPILAGVLFECRAGELRLVATDTYRLVKLTIPGHDGDWQAVIGDEFVNVVWAMREPADSELTLAIGNGRIWATCGSTVIVSQLRAGTFPNYERVIPAEHSRVITVSETELHGAIRRVRVFAKGNANRMRMLASPNGLTIKARTEDFGAYSETVDCDGTREIEIAFNARFMLDALRHVDLVARIELTESSRPAVIKSDGDESWMCVIMPMALA